MHQESSKSLPASHIQARKIHSDYLYYTPEAIISQKDTNNTPNDTFFLKKEPVLRKELFCFAKNKAVVSSIGSLMYAFNQLQQSKLSNSQNSFCKIHPMHLLFYLLKTLHQTPPFKKILCIPKLTPLKLSHKFLGGHLIPLLKSFDLFPYQIKLNSPSPPPQFLIQMLSPSNQKHKANVFFRSFFTAG